jgi:hypothetical protein
MKRKIWIGIVVLEAVAAGWLGHAAWCAHKNTVSRQANNATPAAVVSSAQFAGARTNTPGPMPGLGAGTRVIRLRGGADSDAIPKAIQEAIRRALDEQASNPVVDKIERPWYS